MLTLWVYGWLDGIMILGCWCDTSGAFGICTLCEWRVGVFGGLCRVCLWCYGVIGYRFEVIPYVYICWLARGFVWCLCRVGFMPALCGYGCGCCGVLVSI